MTPAIIGFAAAIVTAVFAYLEVVRRSSGKIANSEASRLWDESSAIRETFRQENENLRTRIETCEKQIRDLTADNDKIRAANQRLREENEELREEIGELKARVVERLSDGT